MIMPTGLHSSTGSILSFAVALFNVGPCDLPQASIVYFSIFETNVTLERLDEPWTLR